MFHNEYAKFVRSEPVPDTSHEIQNKGLKDGEEAKRLYLEELVNVTGSQSSNHITITQPTRKRKIKKVPEIVSNQKLFRSVENNDVDKIRYILDSYPDKINTVDEYGWSLLMIACQANSTEVIKELLNRGIDTTIRDNAGNSAQSLVIKNKNTIIAGILLNHKKELSKNDKREKKSIQTKEKKFKNTYSCTICDNKTFYDKNEHLSSTLHNINVSRGKKLPTNYIIPESNRGFQIMLKGGWDKESGLGRDGSGTKYPIKAVLKCDKSGLGHRKKQKNLDEKSEIKTFKKKVAEKDEERNRRFEINFRREFY